MDVRCSAVTLAVTLGALGGPATPGSPAEYGEGAVAYLSDQGVHTVMLDGRFPSDIADYKCIDCAGAVVAAPLPLENPKRFFYWTDSDANKLITVYRTALEPPGGKGTPEVLCTVQGESIVAGLTVDYQRDPSWVYFTAAVYRIDKSAWQLYKCPAGKPSNPPPQAQPFLLYKFPQGGELGGSLAFAPTTGTLYLLAMQGSSVVVMQRDSATDGGQGKIFGSTSQNTMIYYDDDFQSAGGLSICGDRAYIQTVGLNDQLGAISWMSSDPTQRKAAPDGTLADEMTPAIPFMQRPRSGSDTRVQPPNFDCAADAPGWVIFADDSGHIKGLQVEQDKTVDIYTPATAAGGTGPMTWYFRTTEAPSVSPTAGPSVPPSAHPTTLFSGPPTKGPSTSAPSAPPQPTTDAPVGPTTSPSLPPSPGPSAPPIPVPTLAPQPITAAPTGEPSIPPTSFPTLNPQQDEGSDPMIGIIVGAAVAVFCCICWGLIVWYMRNKMKKEETPPEDKSMERELMPMPKAMAFEEGAEVRIVADNPAVQAALKSAGLPPLEDEKAGKNCVIDEVHHESGTYTVKFPDGTSAVVPESCVTDRLPTPEPEPEPEPIMLEEVPAWQVGDRCEEFLETLPLQTQCEQAKCKYVPEMEAIVGRGGEVVQVHPKKPVVRVKFDNEESYVVPASALRKPSDGGGWFLGDNAQVTTRPEELERLCRESPCGWIDEMDTLPGALVKVLEVKPKSHEVKVGIEGNPRTFVVPSAALQKPIMPSVRREPNSTPLNPPRSPLPSERTTPIYTHGIHYSGKGEGPVASSKWVSVGVNSTTRTPHGSFSPGLQSSFSPSEGAHTPRSPHTQRGRGFRESRELSGLHSGLVGSGRGAEPAITPPNRAGSLRIRPGSRQGSHSARHRQASNGPAPSPKSPSVSLSSPAPPVSRRQPRVIDTISNPLVENGSINHIPPDVET